MCDKRAFRDPTIGDRPLTAEELFRCKLEKDRKNRQERDIDYVF